MAENQLRVLTYNIHKGFSSGNRRFVIHQIRDALVATGSDVLFLQEIQGQHLHREQKVSDWPDVSQFEFIADEDWPHCVYGKNAIYDAGHHGNAILSRFPFEEWENLNVSPYSWASRSLLHGVVRIPSFSQSLHIVCIHLGLTAIERRRQIKILCERIDSDVPIEAPLILAGDFNDWSGQAERYFYNYLGLKEVFHNLHGRYARTFPARWPLLPMDRIYFRSIEPISCEQLGHRPWRMLSDHVPLTASFQL